MSVPNDRVVLVFNPVAGQGDPEERRARLERAAADRGVSMEVLETTPDCDAGELAERAARSGATRVIVVGGDGSVTAAAGTLAGTGVALGVVPAGTANLLAYNAGIPTDPDEAFVLALTGEPRTFDLGRVGKQPFLVVAGIGADAHAVREADREAKNRLGILAYALAAINSLRRGRVLFDLELDGRPIRRRARSVLVANVGSLPGIRLVSSADPSDGIFDVAIVRARTPLDAVVILGQSLLGRAGRDRRLDLHRATHVRVQTLLPQPFQLDGEEGSETTLLDVSIQPGAVHLVCPESPQREAVAARAGRAALLPIALLAGAAWLVLRRRKRS